MRQIQNAPFLFNDEGTKIAEVQNPDGSNSQFMLSKLSPLSKYMGSQIYANVQAQATTATNFCYHMTIVIPTDAKRFRVAIDNAIHAIPLLLNENDYLEQN